jgi:hypothetical protein
VWPLVNDRSECPIAIFPTAYPLPLIDQLQFASSQTVA